MPLHVSSEGLVTESVDNGTEEARQDLDDYVEDEAYNPVVVGQEVAQALSNTGTDVAQHA